MVMEDDETLRSTMVEILTEGGLRVLSAADGAHGLALIAQQPSSDPVRVLITDIKMPVVDGLEVIETLNREQPSLPIIAISGGGMWKERDIS